MTEHVNREAWLTAAVDTLRPVFGAADYTLPDRVAISCGFPGGANILKTVGQCWGTETAADGLSHVFISPLVHEPAEVLHVLVHELCHAIDDCEHGHRKPFGIIARAVGLEGKLTTTVPSDELAAWLELIAAELGPYPHAGITPKPKKTKQGTRMRKVECPACGYIVRTTAKWIAVGVPTCPCDTQMVAEPAEDEPSMSDGDEGEAA